MAYATYTDVEAGFRELDADERTLCTQLLDEAAIIIDAFSHTGDADAKKLVSCRMVRRAIGDSGGISFPMGASQGTMSAGGYSQSWTLGSGSTGELYLSKLEKSLLGCGNAIGSYSPVQELAEGGQ